MGTGERGTITARPSAASCSLHVQRTMSAPAAASAYPWARVPSVSAVFVTVMDWTDTGAPPPTGTFPTFIWRVLRRSANVAPVLAIDRQLSGVPSRASAAPPEQLARPARASLVEPVSSASP